MTHDPMDDADFDYIALQHRFPGKIVVRVGNHVLLSADSYEELSKTSETMNIDWTRAITQFVERPDCVYIHTPMQFLVDRSRFDS